MLIFCIFKFLNDSIFRHKSNTTRQKPMFSRPATHDDLPLVMTIGSSYGGRDFMSEIFPRFVDSHNVVARVYFLGEKLVGFSAVQLIDGGETAWLRAARFKDEFKKQGFGPQLLSCMATEFPDVSRTVYATVDEKRHDIRQNKLVASMGLKELYKKRIINRVFTPASLKVSAVQDDVQKVVRICAADLLRMSRNQVLSARFFPEGRIFVHSVYLKLIPDNFREIVSENSQIYVTSSSDVRGGSSQLSEDYMTNVDMVSTAFFNLAACGLLYEVDILPGSSDKSLSSHIQHHVRQMKELAEDRGVLMLTIGDDLDKDLVISCLQKYGVTQPFPESEEHIIFIEMDNIKSL